jgi:hypothetical protein
MKKILLILAVLALAFPGFAKTQQIYEFKPIGHGPLENNIGTPMSVCALKDDAVAVFDASTSCINTYDKSGKLTKRIRVKAESLISSSVPTELEFGNFVQPVSFDVDESGIFYILTQSNLGKLENDGSTNAFLEFSKMSPSLTTPMMVHIIKDKIYILDQKLGVVVFDTTGKYLKTIGSVGKGSGKFIKPINFWVSIDGSVVILDSRDPENDENTSSTEMLLLMYDYAGNLVREFGPAYSGSNNEDYTLIMPWVGTMSRTAIYIVDFYIKDTKFGWAIKQFNLEGDYVKTWPIIKTDKLEEPSLLKDLIISMDCGLEDSIFFTMPFSGKVLSDPTAFYVVTEGVSSNNSLKLPTTAITTTNEDTYILDIYPPVIHHFDAQGKLVLSKEIKDNFSQFPGLDLAFGLDMVYTKDAIVVSTGLSVLVLNPLNLETIDEVDLTSGSMNINPYISLAWKDGYLAALDDDGKISVTTGGIPVTFETSKDFQSQKLTDITFDKNGSLLVLDSVGKKIGMFTNSGTFLGKIDIDQSIKTPISICSLPTGEIAIVDCSQGQIMLATSNGSVLETIGKNGSLDKMETEQDYMANPGQFYHPTHITSNSNGLMTVVDNGNCRVQKITNSTPPPPEKTPAKLSLTHTKIDFGKVYYENETNSVQIGIENLGQTDMSGIIKAGTGKIKVSPKIITPETKTVTVSFVPDRTMAWRAFSDKLSIETNGGNLELPITANVIGKTIKMTIGSASFQVTTDKQFAITSTRSPEIVSGRTYVPLRATGDIFNAKIDWDSTAKKVTFTMDGKTIELWIGKTTATVDGVDVPLSSPPIILKNSTYVPIRFVSEQMGSNVEWDGEQKIVTITYPKP